MVTFLPFPGYRPSLKNNEDIGDRISPPYDVINDEYLKELQENKNNVTRLTLSPENSRYKRSRDELESWIKDGSLVQDANSFYLYRQNFVSDGKKMTRTGIVGILRTEPYENGNVIPHEETFSKVKEDRLNLLRDMETHLESIFGIFEGFSKGLDDKISKAAEKLYYYVDSSDVEHIYYKISDKKVTDAITKELKGQKMLIADGHHRYETALNYSLENPDNELKGYVLATIVSSDDPGLVIWPTHRLLDSRSVNEDDAIRKIRGMMKVADAGSVDDMCNELPKWQMGLMFRSGRCLLARHENPGDPLWSLDTYVAQEIVIKRAYGYDEGDVKVSYDAVLDSVIRKMGYGKHDAAIVLNIPSLKTIWDLSSIGKRMPKKTTYFFPKIWSGFVFYKMSR
ncbi:MAG: DUF1015 domain-containing protein [Methanomassiliicoccaceae archaeon]|jgi:uncharacterized protein (DUF1015 family)|nr:DUF1015 domain-containing protein [Methanomassiliicoccaceae archaeon]